MFSLHVEIQQKPTNNQKQPWTKMNQGMEQEWLNRYPLPTLLNPPVADLCQIVEQINSIKQWDECALAIEGNAYETNMFAKTSEPPTAPLHPSKEQNTAGQPGMNETRNGPTSPSFYPGSTTTKCNPGGDCCQLEGRSNLSWYFYSMVQNPKSYRIPQGFHSVWIDQSLPTTIQYDKSVKCLFPDGVRFRCQITFPLDGHKIWKYMKIPRQELKLQAPDRSESTSEYPNKMWSDSNFVTSQFG